MSNSINYRAIVLLGLAWCLTATAQDYTDPIHRTGMENSVCPNGSREDAEQCDDNNGTVGDGCAANCRLLNCGDAQLDAPYENCDDGDSESGDGCDGRFCFQESGWSCAGLPSVCSASCGDGLIRGMEQCDDGDTDPMDGCDANCQVEFGYLCAGEPSICGLSCGNGQIDPGEQCDDGSPMSGDGCSGTCQTEPGFVCAGLPSLCVLPEQEPNEDGTPSTGGSGTLGNDIGSPTVNNAVAGGIYQTSPSVGILRRLQLTPVGDEDVFVVQNDDTARRIVRADIWRGDAGFGVGVPCGGDIDTVMSLREPTQPFDASLASPALAVNDDRGGGADRCSGLSFELPVDGIAYIHITEFGDNAAIASDLILQISSQRHPCGNGDVQTELGEVCDDGNIVVGDGCSDSCAVESNFICRQEPSRCYRLLGEPNDDGVPNIGSSPAGNDFGPPTIANVAANSGPAVELIPGQTSRRAGNISPSGDEDIFEIHNAQATQQLVRIETWQDDVNRGEGFSCIGGGSNVINTRNENGGGLDALINQSSRPRLLFGADTCAYSNVLVDPGVSTYAQILQANDDLPFGPYLITVQSQDNQCADGVIQGIEVCDDGANVDGDGCSATCLEEVGYQCTGAPSVCVNCALNSEVEPNGSAATATVLTSLPAQTCSASIAPIGDLDFYRFTLTGRATVRLSLDDAELSGTCDNGQTDTFMALIGPDGSTVLATDDDDGPGLCPMLGAPEDTALVGLQPGNYFVRINETDNDDAVLEYRLNASLVSLCRNGLIEPTETCDDGNVNNGDGCSSQCAVEPGYQCGGMPSFCGIPEPEPNEDGSVSAGGADFLGNDAGSPSIANSLASLGIKNLSTAPHTINGNLIPTGDEDIVVITNDTGVPQNVRVDIWRNHPGFGEGVPCGGTFDTMLRIADAQAGGLSGTTIAQNDDRPGGGDTCSGLSFAMLPGETKYAQLITFHDNRAMGGYRMNISSTGSVCGNFQIQAGEQCDDGNTSSGDFCSAACQLSNDASESEPNNSHTDVISNDNFAQADYLLNGSINPVGDNDWVGLRVQGANTVVRLETLSALTNCDARTTSLGLYNFAGASLMQDGSSGIGSCSAITVPLPDTNDYFFRVGEQGDNLTIPNYLLEVQFHTETLPETEPNDTLATANTNLVSPFNHLAVPGDHSVAIDVDWYRIEVPAGATVRAEIVEFDRNVETCESNGIDSRLTLFNSAGTSLAGDDDDGRGFCSKIDGKDGDTGARNNSPSDQTWYLRVDASGGASANGEQFAYRLVYSVR